MQPDFLKDAEEWFVIAETDLSMAKLALEASPMIGSGVAYNAQQAAEKSIKGFLTAYGMPFPKTHDLEEILKLCEAIEPRFQRFSEAAQSLSPYAIEFRYPGVRATPPDAEARIAYQHATEILQFVRAVLADAGSPPASR